MKRLKLGIIGMSEGNGHPYSWSAIINGYNMDHMLDCPFPVIPEYLFKEPYPENYLCSLAEVTHIWTQDFELSNHIAKASKIPNVVKNMVDMIGYVDAILLARDDAKNHLMFATPFLKAGLPIYIDKPFALNIKDSQELWSSMKYENQIFTCSALQFSEEFQSNKIDFELIGDIKAVWATIPKSWDKYAVHLIEPVLNLIPQRGKIIDVQALPIMTDQIKGVQVKWASGVMAQFQTTGIYSTPLVIRIQGSRGYQELNFLNSFYAFREALKNFIEVVNGSKLNIKRAFTEEVVKILECIENA